MGRPRTNDEAVKERLVVCATEMLATRPRESVTDRGIGRPVVAPEREEQAEVHQRVADRGHLPVDDRGDPDRRRGRHQVVV